MTARPIPFSAVTKAVRADVPRHISAFLFSAAPLAPVVAPVASNRTRRRPLPFRQPRVMT